MRDQTMDSLMQRLDRLERENRRLKLVGVLTLAMVAAIVLMGQTSPESKKFDKISATWVSAKVFELTDLAGETRAEWTAFPSGTPWLTFYHPGGKKRKARLQIALGDDGSPSLSLIDENGELRASLGTLRESALLGFFDKEGKPRALLGLNPDGAPSISLGDKDGNVRAGLDVWADGIPALRFWDGTKNLRAALLGEADGRIALHLFTMDGKERVRLNVLADGRAGLAFIDRKGKGRAVLMALSDGSPRLVFSDEDEKVIWKAP